jgi:tight adherence protein C
MQIVFYFALAFTVFCMAALLMAPVLLKPAPEVQRVLDVTASRHTDARAEIGAPDELRDKLILLAESLRIKLGFGENKQLRARLSAAGMRSSGSPDIFFAAQFLTPLVGAFAGSFIHDNTLFWVLALAVVGYMVPDFWLTFQQGKRKTRIRRSMPDAMDLLVICVDAGLGLDQALLRVGAELGLSHPDISQEFAQVNMAQRAGQARIEAWQDLAERTKIEEFTSFTSMLAQTDRFGTPLTKALARFSEELRMKRRQHAEEAATKTKIKIIFPLVLCIFPCIFIVLLAPAILIVVNGMKGVGGN